MNRTSVLVSLVIVPALAASAFATDRKVGVGQTFTTIGDAVAAASAGDRILVGRGVYQENVVAGVNLQFIGKGAIWDGTLVNGTNGVCLTATGDGTVVQGFLFRAGGSAALVQLTGNGCRVSKCVCRGPNGQFLKITGNTAKVDGCRLFAANSTAIEIDGDDAIVQKLSSQQCDDDVVQINGNNATVTKCSFQSNEDSYSIEISGNGARVTSNRFLSCDDAIRVVGDDPVVEGNNLSFTGQIVVTGDNLSIRRNVIKFAPDDDDGIVASSTTSAGGGVIEGNVLTEITEFGIDVKGHHLAVTHNKITQAGTESDESAFRVSGDNNSIDNIAVVGGGTHGFVVEGAGNTFLFCSASDCAADGFHIEGAGTTLTQCSAKLCTGEGLDNGSTGTIVIACTFKGNRIDVANDGSFTNFAASNVFTTGGTTTAPQVD
jgi:hypothetical protein